MLEKKDFVAIYGQTKSLAYILLAEREAPEHALYIFVFIGYPYLFELKTISKIIPNFADAVFNDLALGKGKPWPSLVPPILNFLIYTFVL